MRRNPTVATSAMFRLERELAGHADHAYRGGSTNEAALPSGDPPDFGAATELGDAIAEYARDQSLAATAAYSRYAGEIAELALEALAAGGKPLRDAAMYLARAGHLAEAGAMWNELRNADLAVRALEGKHNRQDQSYRATRALKATALREKVRPALEQLLKASPSPTDSECARRLLNQFKQRTRRKPGQLPSERNLRRVIAELRSELIKR